MAKPARRIDTLQTVELADGIEIHLRVAGPYLRLMAWIIDLLAKIALMLVYALLVQMTNSIFGYNVASGFMTLGYFLILWFYHVLFEVSKSGATLGKKAMGLRVVNEAGGPISMGQSMVRNFVRFFEMIIPFLGIMAFFHPRFQRLGDLAAGTLVVYSRARLDPMTPGPPPLNSVPVAVALTREEEAAIMSYRDRSGSWSEGRRAELGNHLVTLTGQKDVAGVNQILGMANWLEARR
ncbi:RDD family protein [Akkermansiaceae bacterium]|nr:RDD family protein [Akkermansiaceae bacterium]MDA7887911.1 RDD family protein [Akkermansiaceae bacterium]